MGCFCSRKNHQDDERRAMLEESSNASKLLVLSGTGYGTIEALNNKSETNKLLTSKASDFIREEKSNIINEHADDAKDAQNKGQNEEITISETNLLVSKGGYDAINGKYRWFAHSQKWCLFRDDASYSMENGVSPEIVYAQLNEYGSAEKDFRWGKDVNHCWIISNMDRSAICYAAPQASKGKQVYIPSDRSEWISVLGSLPAPLIHAYWPDETETKHELENVSESDDESISDLD